MSNKVTIIPFSISEKDREIKVFRVNTIGNFQFIENDVQQDLTIQQLLIKTISGYFKLNPDWVIFSLVGVKRLEQSTSVDIIYTCLIPETVEIITGQWDLIQNITGDKEYVKLAAKKIWQ